MTFNEWREKYGTLSLDEQVQYHNVIETQYPEQAHYTYDNVKKVLYKGATVLEFGTWKADLAQKAIIEFNLSKWQGIEICSNAIEKTRCTLKEFSYIKPDKFDWWVNPLPNSDIIIATHFIEHLSNEHFEQLVKVLKAKYIYFEAPLTEVGEDWAGYVGTHKLKYGWNDVNKLMAEQGYKITHDFIEGKIYSL